MEYIFICMLPLIVICVWAFDFIESGRYHSLSDKAILYLMFMVGTADYILLRLVLFGFDGNFAIFLDNLEILCALSISPLYYICIRAMVFDTKWHKWFWWLFLPASSFCVACTALSFAVGWDRILEIRNCCNGRFVPAPGNIYEILYKIVHTYAFIVVFDTMAVILIYVCLLYFHKYYKKSKNFYADLHKTDIGDINRFICSAILLLLTTIFISYVRHYTSYSCKGVYICINLWLCLLYWELGKYARRIQQFEKDSAILSFDEKLPESSQENEAANIQPPVSQHKKDDELNKKVISWKQREDHPYCHEGITLSNVANDIGINPRVLSNYVNTVEQKNFNMWINTLRVEEAKRLISSDNDVKFSYIADVCGFPDQAVFSKVFHKIEGVSPNNYRTALHESRGQDI